MPQWRSSRAPEVVDRPIGLPSDAGAVLLPLARAAIGQELGDRPARGGAPDWLAHDWLAHPWLADPGASFVTLHTAGALSGCIGSLVPHRPLGSDVRDNARAAAFRDPRFPALTRAGLDDTVIDVSVLSAATPLAVRSEADALARIRPGVDGLVLEYAGRRATFLPQVWSELPDPRDFLARLKIKLGLPPTFWSDSLTLARYTVTAFTEGEPS